MSKTEIVEFYKATLQEIEVVKKRFNIESLAKKERQTNLEKEINEKIKNGTATGLERMMLYIKLDFFFDSSNRELDLLIERARNLAIRLFGEDVAFPTIKDFLKKASKRIKKILQCLNGQVSYTPHSIQDKRLLISQFRKLLIKVNQDDVDNSTTQIKNIINRVLNFHNKQNGYVIRYKKSNHRHLVMQ